MSAEPRRVRMTARVGPEQAGLRLDQAAAELFGDFSRGRLQKWIRSGELSLDGRAAKPTSRVAGGETLRLDAVAESDESVIAQDIPLDILYRDGDILVLDKPAGLVVHPAAGNRDGTLQNALLHFEAGLATLPRAGIVHRLDKDTSGVMVVARSLRAHTGLVQQLQARSMSRVYRAVAHGAVRADGVVDAPLGRHPRERKRMAVVPAGRHAVSHYRVLEHFEHATYLQVSLETGRTHQIRVHLAHIGHPLVGDPVYGRSLRIKQAAGDPALEAMRAFPRQALHARQLTLRHPGSGQEMRFEAPLPADFSALLETLRRASP